MAVKRPRSKPPSQRAPRFAPDRFTAIHEAGHAVVAVLLGLDLRSVDFRQRELNEGESLGTTDIGVIPNGAIIAKGRDAVFPLMTFAMAGVAAESRWNSKASMLQAGREDFRMAQEWAVFAICNHRVEDGKAVVGPDAIRSKEGEIVELIREAADNATRLVEDNTKAIRVVADHLMRRGRLAGAEVAAIVRYSPPT